MDDITSLEGKLGWSLSKREMSRTGKLRLFLEELLQKRFMDSVPMIIPLLVKKYCSTTRILNEINKELRTACVIAIAKARDTFEPFLDQVYNLSIVNIPFYFFIFLSNVPCNVGVRIMSSCPWLFFGKLKLYASVIPVIRCMEDLAITTRNVTWSCTIRTFLPVLHDGMLIYNNITGFVLYFSTIRKVGKERSGNFGAEEIVGWFNCFLLMPVIDKLTAFLREDLETAFEDDLDNVFDITNL
ncbi:Dynamin-like protein ARC5 [Citrus sinensis]|uniref:Dynamin-like protein ARC5 n=1 Tax=Citrus sinensis TaxID=2711 RepID=A0ACB8KCX1_CITSI|nr:Dynamin-like protein ARC5 [Citrus sinensis]